MCFFSCLGPLNTGCRCCAARDACLFLSMLYHSRNPVMSHWKLFAQEKARRGASWAWHLQTQPWTVFIYIYPSPLFFFWISNSCGNWIDWRHCFSRCPKFPVAGTSRELKYTSINIHGLDSYAQGMFINFKNINSNNFQSNTLNTIIYIQTN